MITALAHENIARLPHVGHAFFTRKGGVGTDFHEGLSIKPKEGREDASAQNMRLAALHVGLEEGSLVLPFQVHSALVKRLDAPFDFLPSLKRPHVDGLWTTTPGLGLGVNTADCVPLLIAHKTRPLVASLHAGWKGALAGIVENMIEALTAQGAKPQDLVAAIGPAIAQESYEVGGDVYDAFTSKYPHAKDFFKQSPTSPQHMFFDLPGFVVWRLEASGVTDVAPSLWNTYQCEDTFFSCRRAFHKGEADFGCQISAIWIR